MPPIGDSTLQGLQEMVQKLEQRVQELEGRLAGGPSKTAEGSVRMILMGPPGAGMCLLNFWPIWLVNTFRTPAN
jgi:adenylate kinase